MIAKLIKGKGFRGALEYDLQKQKGHILETNMAGTNPRTLAREFGSIRALRPNLGKAVCHVSLSIAPDEALKDEQWKEVAHDYLENMGFKNNQYVISKHTDTEHPHIHILVNRIGMDGSVVSDSQDYKRQEAIMRRLEQEYGLKTVEPSREAERKTLSKGEIEHVLRTGEASARMRLQKMIDETLVRPMALSVFVSHLEKRGVEVKLNESSTGTISGISFCLYDIALKGSDLGKKYTWKSLQNRGLHHGQVGKSAGIEQGRSEQPGRGGDFGNAPKSVEPAGNEQAEKQRRIDQNFARLAYSNQRLDLERTTGRARSQGLSR